MPLYVLTETSAGYALFKASDKKLLSQGSEHVIKHTHDATATAGLLKLKKFAKFGSAAEALDQAAAVQDGKVTPMLQKLLDSVKEEKKASLAVADAKIGKFKSNNTPPRVEILSNQRQRHYQDSRPQPQACRGRGLPRTSPCGARASPLSDLRPCSRRHPQDAPRSITLHVSSQASILH